MPEYVIGHPSQIFLRETWLQRRVTSRRPSWYASQQRAFVFYLYLVCYGGIVVWGIPYLSVLAQTKGPDSREAILGVRSLNNNYAV